MATMIPRVESSTIHPSSEGLVYQALDALPAAYLVLHSYPWLRPTRDQPGAPLREGEADFVVLHPQLGLLVLEVKGGQVDLIRREWFYRIDGRLEPMKDPFKQAQRSLHKLLDEVEARTGRAIRRGSFTYGYGVVFPTGRVHGVLPFDAAPALVVDALGLEELPARLEAMFAAWGPGPQQLSPSEFRVLAETLLPSLRLVRCARPELAIADAQLVQLTRDQHATLSGLFVNPRVMVEGVAGSGKTLLALEVAITRAAQGLRVQMLCFNRNLAAWLKEQLQRDPRAQAASGGVRVDSFHALALGLARDAGVEFNIPEGAGGEAFWAREAAQLMDQATRLLRGGAKDPTCDVLVIDEAQDFQPEWWIALEELLKDPDEGSLYVFLDVEQRLRGGGELPPLDLPVRFALTTNCRNTRRIASSGASLLGLHVDLLRGAPLGVAPRLLRAPDRAAQAGVVLAEVRRLLGQDGLQPRQIALIGPAGRDMGALSRVAEVAGVGLVTDAEAWRSGDGVLCTTARAFKGLEADVVIVYDLDALGGAFTSRDLYVAWTRAKHQLILVSHGAVARSVIEQALATMAAS